MERNEGAAEGDSHPKKKDLAGMSFLELKQTFHEVNEKTKDLQGELRTDLQSSRVALFFNGIEAHEYGNGFADLRDQCDSLEEDVNGALYHFGAKLRDFKAASKVDGEVDTETGGHGANAYKASKNGVGAQRGGVEAATAKKFAEKSM